MKSKLLMCFFTIWSLTSFSQDKASLTKEETVNYLNKKINEIKDYSSVINSKSYYHRSSEVKSSKDNLKISYDQSNYKQRPEGTLVTINDRNKYKIPMRIYPCDYFIENITQEFNPAYIVSVEIGNNDQNAGTVGFMQITLKSKTVKYLIERNKTSYTVSGGNNDGECGDFQKVYSNTNFYTIVYFPYLKADDTNFNKIKKALEYLRDLYKAEDDPFGN
ncbi:hypothetical protein [Ferruginibacter sp.]